MAINSVLEAPYLALPDFSCLLLHGILQLPVRRETPSSGNEQLQGNGRFLAQRLVCNCTSG